MSAPPKIFIATPTTNGIMLSDTVASTIGMITQLHGRGIATRYHTTDGYSVMLQRDWLVQAFLASDCTHLLFIDSDMAFEPGLCEKLLAAQKPLIGTIYTKRALDLAKLKSLIPAHGFDHALALTYDWNVRYLGSELTVRQGLCRVEGVGFGFALLERGCFLAQADETPSYRSPIGGVQVRAFFRPEPGTDGGHLDHDYSFCRRWVVRGGEVWAETNAQIRHVGDFRYGVPFRAYLNALNAAAPAANPQAMVAPEPVQGGANGSNGARR